MTRARAAGVRGLALLLATVWLCWASGSFAQAYTVAFTIKDSRITESSGLTRDVPGHRYWTANDSGNSARAYAFSQTGRSLGYLKFRAKTVDVEALQYYQGTLYLADIGDNTSKRRTVTIYKIYNPQPNGKNSQYEAYDFTYPDGPRDAETLLISPKGRIYLVSKEADGGVYAAPEFPSRLRSNRLQRIADAPSFVTDGTFLPDGKIAVRTYVSVQVLDPRTYKVIAQAPTPAEPQGESLSVDLTGRALLVGSEGVRQPVYSMAIPTRVTTAPSAGPTPGTPKPTPTPSRSAADPQDTQTSPDTSGSSGATVPLLLAGGVALVAGLITLGVRSRR